ncbi:HAD family hydrolase [Pasteurella skyensis]|uniref:HAD family hydrolase n=1 Tax=Phocoenobacter skyensis TaxID=97481 RepID=A0AAJ6N8R4_9PAST|nr:HAD family hydrolase [Pasteurella skyensis]MDP8162380.1 HAD family hydrolase [Pasteurella skyensis]MDP8172286.1 HAD family hydrolase [Pasteurella skyensis]MDP8178541.1 HAD family hydrolase [Pasteurella skyensis]MDP8182543.1 HAD family hydrolase [Pasteurella skyensis]MDP8188848.1 HAD family hydrolase [Pasteurella skyensis]
MKYKGFLLDIDDTIYDYTSANKIALDNVVQFCKIKFNLDETTVINAYMQARNKTHFILQGTGSSHNRLLYIQKMLEDLGVNPLRYGLQIYNIYWDTFLENMQIFPFVDEFFDKFGEQICFVTDLTSHIQFRKIQQLGLTDKVRYIVTSEATGHEKPHPFMFLQGLQKLNLPMEQVCMIGDSFEKDILGARNVGLDGFWLNLANKKREYSDKGIIEIHAFSDLKNYV